MAHALSAMKRRIALCYWRSGLALSVLSLPWLLVLWFGLDEVLQAPEYLASWLAYPGLLTMVNQSVQVALVILLIAWLAVLSIQPLAATRGWLVQIIALPHVAFAIGLLWLFAPYGWLWRWLPEHWQLSLFDRQHLASFMLILMVKEVPFLWLMGQRALAQMPWQRWLLSGQSLGYSRQRSWWLLVMPELLRRLRLPVLIVVVYSLSVVDVALVAAPQTPAPLAVQVLQWQLDAQPDAQHFAAYGAFALLLLALLAGGLIMVVERFTIRQLLPRLGNFRLRLPVTSLVRLLGLAAALAIVAQSIAVGWFFPERLPSEWSFSRWQQELPNMLWLFAQSGVIAMLVASLSVAWVVLLLEWRRRLPIPGLTGLMLAPLLLPQLTVLLAWQGALGELTGGGAAWLYGLVLIAVQIPYSAAYAYLILAPAEQRFEQRLVSVMQSYGYRFWPSWWLIKRRLLQQPLLLAWVFAALVSMAQYLPIILLGGGRWPTLTSELVAISSGANSQLVAIYAVGQWLLALLFLMLLAWPLRAIEGEQQ